MSGDENHVAGEADEVKKPVEVTGAYTTSSVNENSTSVNNVTIVPAADQHKDSWLNRNIAPLLALLILVASFGFFGYVLEFDFSETSKLKDIVILLIGIVSTLVTTVISYYFGSSHGSSNKSKFIQNGNGPK